MFSDKKVTQDRFLGALWKEAYSFDVYQSRGREEMLSRRCSELLSWVNSDVPVPENRLSLRTSVTMLAGATKLFKEEADQLLKDVENLDREIQKGSLPTMWGGTEPSVRASDSHLAGFFFFVIFGMSIVFQPVTHSRQTEQQILIRSETDQQQR